MRSYKLTNSMSSVLAVSIATLCMAGPAQYSITDLGTLVGPGATTAPGAGGVSINNAGLVAGFSIASGTERNIHAFRWANGAMTDLVPISGAVHSHGFAMNNAGVVVGASYTMGELEPTAMRWTNMVPESIGNFVARGINDGGVIVGERLLSPMYAQSMAVRWTNGTLADLGTLGGSSSGAYAIDASGRIVGMSLLAGDASYHAFLWQGGTLRDLGTLGGARSHAFDINNTGQIVGFAQTASGAQHAFVFQIDAAGNVTSRTDLGATGAGFSYAFAINETGVIVGSSDSRATLWDGAGIHDLNLMIPQDGSWELMKATAINDDGMIIGQGKHFGLPRTFLLGPAVLGDFDGDGHVDIFDLFALLSAWGDCGLPCPPSCDADIANAAGNGTDCTVNVFDLLALLSNWG